MIKVKFCRKDGKLISFLVVGHAECEQNGNYIYDDVVCGVISALSVATINGITDVVKISCDFHANDGNIGLDISNNSANEISMCQVLMETLLLSFENLKIVNKEYIKLKIEEV